MDNPQGQGALTDSLSKTKEIVAAVQHLQKQQEDADKKASSDHRAHAEAKQRIKAIELEQVQIKQAAENEAKIHQATKEKLEKEARHHAKTRETDRIAKEDVAKMHLQMDSMKVEMEAQRKAFVINVNWAARCTELKTQYDQSNNDYDQLFDEHVKTKSAINAALRAQEELRMKCQIALDSQASIQEEMARQVAEFAAKSGVSDEVAAKLAELDEFRAKQAIEDTQKKLGNQQALSVLQRSLAQGDKGITTSSFQGWATLTATEKKDRLHKDRAMKRALKTISSEGTGLVLSVFKEWRADLEKSKRAALLAATKRLEAAASNAGAGSMTGRQRAIAQLEKQFVGEDVHLTKSCFQGWALGQVARKKKDQNHKKASRMIANSGKGLLAEIVGLWNDITEKTRKKNRQKASNMQAAGRLIANSDKVLQANIFQTWWGWIEGIRRGRKVKEAGTAKAMRMMANSAQAIMNLCFDSWTKFYRDSKKKDSGNKKALRMMADSAQAMTVAVWQCWSQAKVTSKAKDANTARAVRMINSSGEALTASVFQSWASDVRKDRDRNKKIRVLEKSFGAQDAGRKLVVLTSWQGLAKVEGRHKRAKNLSMKTAIKSITGNQDLLLCHLTLCWARYASFWRMDKLKEATRAMEAKLQDAVERARIAVEQDLVQAQKDVESITAELEGLRKQRDETQGRVTDLKGRLENTTCAVEDYDRQIAGMTDELKQSRRKAKDIGEELGRVGIFINSHSPVSARKISRPGSGSDSRPRSGTSNKNADERLPRIDGSNSRPRSGTKSDGSKSARGVAGERGGSGRSREGRPPQVGPPRVEDDPYTYNELLDISAEKGRENANAQGSSSLPEAQDANSGDY